MDNRKKILELEEKIQEHYRTERCLHLEASRERRELLGPEEIRPEILGLLEDGLERALEARDRVHGEPYSIRSVLVVKGDLGLWDDVEVLVHVDREYINSVDRILRVGLSGRYGLAPQDINKVTSVEPEVWVRYKA